MPNWCSNNLAISGPANELAAFVSAVKVDELDEYGQEMYGIIDMLIPRPAELEQSEAWYSWSVANWGSKWSDCNTRLISRSDSEIEFIFDTAWAPTLEATGTISTMFPTLVFSHQYDEPGMCFMGAAVYKDGVLLADDELSGDDYVAYDFDNDDSSGHFEALDDLFDRVRKQAAEAALTQKESSDE